MSVYKKLLSVCRNSQSPCLVGLIDPDKKNRQNLTKQLDYINNNNFSAIFVGGSLIMDSNYSKYIKLIKNNTKLPVIGFPSSSNQINSNFDAILFLSLVSGRNPQYLIGEHVHSAPILYDLELEPIPVGYILLDGGSRTSVEIISNTRALPMNNHDIIISHALASQYLGHKFIYLECGSNSDNIISLELLSKIKNYIDIPIIVGGGIKNDSDIKDIYSSGADFLVISSMIEARVGLSI